MPFLAGLVTGVVVALLAVAAVPGLVPTRDSSDAPARAPRPNVIVVKNELELPPPVAAPEGDERAEDTVHTDATQPVEADSNEDYGWRLDSYRVAAIATLRNVISAQSQFQTTARADENANGVGEYGSFGELSGAIHVRDGEWPLNPPVLSSAFKKVGHGYVERSGYRFRMYLPQAGGRPVAERDDGGFAPREVDPELAETCWCCYAWPVSGNGPAFFTNQAGDVLATKRGWYGGDLEPPAYAAFQDLSGLAAPTVAELPEGKGRGADGREWESVG